MGRFFLLSTLTLLFACGGGTPTGQGGSASTSSGSGGSTSTGSTSNTWPAITACSDVGAEDCFSNLECTSPDTRCEAVGAEGAKLPCCVPGPRGQGGGGDPCASENDCATGLCIQTGGASLCSPTCTSAQDCPALLPKCEEINPLLGQGSFCFPASAP
jgi:hypothetical protein